jgi:peptidoglycan/xylan/chitin deacetylase (PgdA/CDA1 family)
MQFSGLIDLGSHTHAHRDFRHRPEEFRADLQVSLAVLREQFGVADATFSFPYGHWGPELAAALRQTGVLCGLASDTRLVTPRSDPLRWGRFGATEFDTPNTLAAKLDGWYSFAQDIWRSVC